MNTDTHARDAVRYICDTIGRQTIAESVGCPRTAVSNCIAQGYFPCSWFAALAALGAAHGVSIPLNLFPWNPRPRMAVGASQVSP